MRVKYLLVSEYEKELTSVVGEYIGSHNRTAVV